MFASERGASGALATDRVRVCSTYVTPESTEKQMKYTPAGLKPADG